MTNSAPVDPSEDWDNPELTDADIARMRPARDVLSPEAYAHLGLTEPPKPPTGQGVGQGGLFE